MVLEALVTSIVTKSIWFAVVVKFIGTPCGQWQPLIVNAPAVEPGFTFQSFIDWPAYPPLNVIVVAEVPVRYLS